MQDEGWLSRAEFSDIAYEVVHRFLLSCLGLPCRRCRYGTTPGDTDRVRQSSAREEERVGGFLSIPSTSQARYPLMLIMHSSGGIHARDWFFVRKLNDIGVATFVLDSFGPRGLTKVNEDKRSFGDREQAIDALSALATLGKNTRIDLDHLAAMGRSLGGQTAVRLSLKIAREQLPIRGPTLGLALAITPGCTSQPKDGEVTRGTEVWFFLADHDMSPYQRCISYVEKMVAAGGDAHFRVYPETFHTFDGSLKPIWHPREEVYADCSNDRIGPNYSIRLDTNAGNFGRRATGTSSFPAA